jgi:predicted secreted protein
MSWQAALAIYILFWVMCAFVVLPFEARTHDEAGIEKIAGQADSAPVDFRPARAAIRITIVATLLFALYYANYVGGWITADMLTGQTR